MIRLLFSIALSIDSGIFVIEYFQNIVYDEQLFEKDKNLLEDICGT